MNKDKKGEMKSRLVHCFEESVPFNLTDDANTMRVTIAAESKTKIYAKSGDGRDSAKIDGCKVWDPEMAKGEDGIEKVKVPAHIHFGGLPLPTAPMTAEEKACVTKAYAAAGKDVNEQIVKPYKHVEFHGHKAQFFTITEKCIPFGEMTAAIGILASAPPGLKLEPLTEEAVSTAGGDAAKAVLKPRMMYGGTSANGEVIVTHDPHFAHV